MVVVRNEWGMFVPTEYFVENVFRVRRQPIIDGLMGNISPVRWELPAT